MTDSNGQRSGQRIGLLGGSFDPVHRAHIKLAKTALKHLELDEVQLLPAKQPWQKPPLSASAQQRLAMLELAVNNESGLRVNAMELDRPGKTYTLDTLNALPTNHHYFWLLGADQLLNFPTWHGWQAIAERVTLAVAQRPGAGIDIPESLQEQIDAGRAHVVTLPFEPLAISSSQLRAALKSHQPLHDWLDPAVLAYIRKHRLYD
jgi:nicotinate-nucleotide adenylyltransferase